MKQAFRIVLMLVVLYLNFKPLIDFIELHNINEAACCENTCHTEKTEAENPFHSPKCFGKNCNPFQYCSTCSLLSKTVEIKAAPLEKPAQFATNRITGKEQNYSTTLYQPPQA